MLFGRNLANENHDSVFFVPYVNIQVIYHLVNMGEQSLIKSVD